MQTPFSAYRGDDPYVFVCYAHDDAAVVYPELTRLRAHGVNIWYDEGIAPGELFTNELADRIGGSTTFLYFVSPQSVTSRFCLNEVNYATSHDKRVVAVHLQPTDLPSGLELTIGLAQAILRDAMSERDFQRKVLEAVTSVGPVDRAPSQRTRGRRAGPIIALVLVAAAAVGTWYWITASAPADSSSVAVLPFINASGDPDDVYLSEGLADELRDQLGRLGGLRVAARRSSIAFRDSAADPVDIANQLGVATLISGQLRRQGDSLKIRVELIDGATGYQSWSRNFDTSAEELFAMPQAIAAESAKQLLPGVASDQTFTSESASKRTYDLMLLARHFEQQVRDSQRVDERALARAIELYQKATEADPDSALAHSRLAAALLYRGEVEAAERSILRALELDENSSDVQYTLGLYYWQSGLEGSGSAFERSIALNPNNVEAIATYGMWLMSHVPYQIQHASMTPDRYFERALELDPMSLNRYAALGSYYGLTGKEGYPQRLRAITGLVEERFDNVDGYLLLARLHELLGELDVGIAWALRARDKRPDRNDAVWLAAHLLARIGEFDKANALAPNLMSVLFWQRRYEELVDVGQLRLIDEPEEINSWYMLGFAYNAMGQFPLAVRLLDMVGMPDAALRRARRNDAIQHLVWTYIPALDRTGEHERAHELAEWAEDYMATYWRWGCCAETPGQVGPRPVRRVGENQAAGDTGMATHRGGEAVDAGPGGTWWPRTLRACALTVLGRTDEALGFLEQLDGLSEDTELAWSPVLKDAACFDSFADDPRYQAVIASIDARQLTLRKRLPETLDRYAVSL